MTWKETAVAATDALRELPKKMQREAEVQWPNQTWIANATAIGWIEAFVWSDKGWSEWVKFCEDFGIPVGDCDHPAK